MFPDILGNSEHRNRKILLANKVKQEKCCWQKGNEDFGVGFGQVRTILKVIPLKKNL